MHRPSGRQPDELREIRIERHYTRYAEGSVLVSFGGTRVLCNASFTEGVPPFLRGQGRGWVTAEYGMLPRATHTRGQREAARGKQSGRTVEISRLIGRSLRNAVDMEALGENTLVLDCDVIEADGGTRTAAITGATVAMIDAFRKMQREKILLNDPLRHTLAAVSVGLYQGVPVLDLDYDEDSRADTDLNVVMTGDGGFVEVQGTAEGAPMAPTELTALLGLAETGIRELTDIQLSALRES